MCIHTFIKIVLLVLSDTEKSTYQWLAGVMNIIQQLPALNEDWILTI